MIEFNPIVPSKNLLYLKRYGYIKGFFKAVIPQGKSQHILKGDYNADAGFILTGGLHTVEGLDEFVKQGKKANRNHTIKDNVPFIPGANTSDDILTQTLGNGVIRVQLPRSGVNKKTNNNPQTINGIEYKGTKTLFPKGWTNKDQLNAMHAVLNQNANSLSSSITFKGSYRGVKMIVHRNSKTGVIDSFYPEWDQ